MKKLIVFIALHPFKKMVCFSRSVFRNVFRRDFYEHPFGFVFITFELIRAGIFHINFTEVLLLATRSVIQGFHINVNHILAGSTYLATKNESPWTYRKMTLYSWENPYNPATTERSLISPLFKSAHFLSALISMTYMTSKFV